MNTVSYRACAMAVLCGFGGLAHAAGTGDGLDQLQQGLQNSIERVQQGYANAGTQLQQGLNKAGEQLQNGLGGALGQSASGFDTSLNKLSGSYVEPQAGTASFETTVRWQGLARKVVVIRPEPAPLTAPPAIVLLHFDGGTPALMANLTHAGILAAEQGYWVLLPAAIAGHWQDDPGVPSTIDDVGFLAAVIDDAVNRYGVDAGHVSMAGFSNGGFMTQRMGCERPELLAALLVDAALLRNTEAAACQPSRALPIAFVLGTADPLVPYGGGNGMRSAEQTYLTWAGFNHCASGDAQPQALPDTAHDGTQVSLLRVGTCESGGEVRLYTVHNGGHAWPGGERYLGTNVLGITSGNLDTTRTLGRFAALWSRGTSH